MTLTPPWPRAGRGQLTVCLVLGRLCPAVGRLIPAASRAGRGVAGAGPGPGAGGAGAAVTKTSDLRLEAVYLSPWYF